MSNIDAEKEVNAINWIKNANCKGLTHLFFGHPSERPQATARREQRAQSICNACTVINECREYARRNREYGFWAGENEYDRSVLGFGPLNARLRGKVLERHKNPLNLTQLQLSEESKEQ